jgi:hypothetical protein
VFVVDIDVDNQKKKREGQERREEKGCATIP